MKLFKNRCNKGDEKFLLEMEGRQEEGGGGGGIGWFYNGEMGNFLSLFK